MAKSKFFRVAVEGATTDGRKIERSWIMDMGSTYNRDVRGSRIFAEHIRGVVPDGPFQAYGDVIATKAEEITEGPLKGKMALYNQIEPTDAMVKLVKSGQKIYPSIEIDPEYSITGKPYQAGLGITDSPASLGVDVLTFAAQHPTSNPFASRKQAAGNLFSAAVEPIEIEWEDEPADTTASTLFKAVKDKLAALTGKGKSHDGQFAEVSEALNGVVETLEQITTENKAVSKNFAAQVTALTTRLDDAEAAAKKHEKEFATLRGELESTATVTPRPPANGNGNQQLTDC